MKRRRRIRKTIERRIEFIAAGRVVKTVKTKITLSQATREIGAERLFTRGDTVRIARTIAGCCKVRVTWTAIESLIDEKTEVWTADTRDAAQVIRHQLAL